MEALGIFTKSPTFIYNLEQRCAGTVKFTVVNVDEFDEVAIDCIVDAFQNNGKPTIGLAPYQVTGFH